MKKVNGILIFIMALSIALLAFVMYSMGVFGGEEEATPTQTPIPTIVDGATPTPEQYKEIEPDFYEYLVQPQNNAEIYTYRYQTTVRNKINDLINANDYTIEKPLVIVNPFGTNTLGLYIYFETDEDSVVSYRVHTPAVYSEATEFSGNAYKITEIKEFADGDILEVGNSKIHEFVIPCMIPNETNTVTFTVTDENSKSIARTFYVDWNDIVSSKERQLTIKRSTTKVVDEVTLEEKVVNTSNENLNDGFFAVFSKANALEPYVRVYDNFGCIKMEIPLETYGEKKFVFNNHKLYMRVSDTKLVALNALGEVTDIYISDDYKLTGDYCIDDKNNLLIIAKSGESEDTVIMLDIDKGEYVKLFDMPTILRESSKLDEETIKPLEARIGDYSISSIVYTGDNMVILGVNDDAAIKIRRIYNGPKIVYVVTDDQNLEKLLPEYLLRVDGDFELPSTFSKVFFEEYNLIKESRHYIGVVDKNTEYDYAKKEEHFGYFSRYLIDEDEKTIRYESTVKTPEILDDTVYINDRNHIMFLSGINSIVYEYDNDMKLICSAVYIEPIVDKTIEQKEYEEDNPPADTSITYTGVIRFDTNEWCTSSELVIYKTE